MGEALEGWVCFSWYWVFCVVVVSLADIWIVVAVWVWFCVVSSWMIRVPPPWAISWSIKVVGGSGVPGMVGVGCSGLSIGR